MAPPIKWIGKETSILGLYRNLLKSCARHPDPYVGEWYACQWRGYFKSWFARSPQPQPPEVARLMHFTRSTILRLQRASSGDKRAFDYTVERAYGGKGDGRWPLLKPFTRSRVLPPSISILRDRPHRTLPSYSPFLVSAADSPLMLDPPRPPLRLALPETLPPHGVPANPELLNRQFIDPARETNIRKQYYNALLERIKVPLCVRVVGVQQPEKVEGGEEVKNVWDSLKELGIDWREFSDGRREVLLDRLEQFAGKGAKSVVEEKRTRRTPINEIDPSLPPSPPSPSSSFSRPSPTSSTPSLFYEPQNQHPSSAPSPPPSFPIPRTIHHSSLSPARFPNGYQQIYRNLLSDFPLLTVDLSRIQPPGQWLAIQFSPWSRNGPAFYHPIDPVEDLPYLASSPDQDQPEAEASSADEPATPTVEDRLEEEEKEDDNDNDDSLIFPPFVVSLPTLGKEHRTLPVEVRAAAVKERYLLKQAAYEAEADRRREVVRGKLTRRGLSGEEIEWEMEGKWVEKEKELALVGEGVKEQKKEIVVETEGESSDDRRMKEWKRELERSRERREIRRRAREREGKVRAVKVE